MLELELIFCVWFKASPTFWSYSFPTWNIFSTQFLVPVSAAAAKLLQSCPTLCDPTDGSPPCSPVPGILQARTLERVAISFSNAWKWKVKVKSLSRVRLFATPWTAALPVSSIHGIFQARGLEWVPLPSPLVPVRGKEYFVGPNQTLLCSETFSSSSAFLRHSGSPSQIPPVFLVLTSIIPLSVPSAPGKLE